MDDDRLQARLNALEERVGGLEDQVAVHRLINSWGPAVDIGEADAAASLFSDDSILISDLSRLDGPAAVSAMVHSEGQQSLIRQGCAHVPAFPIVNLEGDRGNATGYTRVYLHTDEGYEVWRVSANHWEFRRTADGWRVSRRTNHVIDGGPEASEILRRAFDGGS